ncbi:MAG: bifunctional folylpolyglutamate synthase/dihydrofolate synthase [Oscillospiraceae bacterium]|nr:bifunctional folylpolyglutamate synthase/dihydrofolate synthase [Oscillospiraceae bacterium]
MNYQESLDFILGTPNPGGVYERNVMQSLLEKLGNPHMGVKYVHIAGTNGKGTTSAFVASVLREAGYKTGLYTSPFIQRFNERIQVNGVQIPDDDLARITTKIADTVPAVMAEGRRRPTIFELITALGFCWFKEQQCDIVVLEVGMGGRLDATNAILDEDSVVSAMVNIGFDHMEFLGDTLPLIAGEKAGIIKEKGDVVVYGQSPEVEKVFYDKAMEKHAAYTRSDNETAVVKKMDVTGTTFRFGPWRDMKIRLLGRYQVRNACTALTVVERLRLHGYAITDEQVYAGMEKAIWPGRAELLRQEPTVIVDGAHNPQGFEALMETMELLFPGKKLNIVLGVLADKDFQSGLDIAIPHAKKFYAVTPPSYRALDAGELAADIRQKADVPVAPFDSIPAAIEAALAESDKDDVIAILGSLYQVGDVRSYFGRNTFEQ